MTVLLLRRRILHCLAALCALAAPAVMLTGSASADSVGSFGWWYQLHDAALPIAPPPPPDAPDGGIYVANTTGVGPIAYGAVEFTSPGTTAGEVLFHVESSTTALEVALCKTTSPWTPADAGVWAERPTFDCGAKALGVLSADGKTLSFGITDALSDGSGHFDLAIVADPTLDVTFRLALTAPGADFFTPTANTPPTVPFVGEPTPQPTFTDPGVSTGTDFVTPDGNAADSGSFLDPPTTLPPAAADASEVAGGPVTTGNALGEQAASTVVPDTGPERVAAGIGLVILAGGLWFAGNRGTVALDPALVKAGAISAAGGIGRFSKVRTIDPIRIG